jgi:NAD(P)H dehydrogenase (quinone)
MIVVTGGNGQLGRHIVQALKELIGPSFIVTVREPEKAADLAAEGIDVRAGDFQNPDEIARGLEGADTMLLMMANGPQEPRVRGHKNAIDAAKKVGIKNLTFVSYLGDQPDSPFPSTPGIFLTVDHLKLQGFEPTLLRNGNYVDGALATVRNAAATGKIVSAQGDGKVSSVSRRDLARATAKILTEGDKHAGKTYALTGPAAYGNADYAKLASELSGKPVVYEQLTLEEYKAQLEAAGTPTAFAMGSAETVRRGLMSEVSNDIEMLTGQAPEDALDYIRRNYTPA